MTRIVVGSPHTPRRKSSNGVLPSRLRCNGIAFMLWWRWLSACIAEEQDKARTQARVDSFVNAIQ
jgi:hypothetical protein